MKLMLIKCSFFYSLMVQMHLIRIINLEANFNMNFPKIAIIKIIKFSFKSKFILMEQNIEDILMLKNVLEMVLEHRLHLMVI
jgi:hypothetical protein